MKELQLTESPSAYWMNAWDYANLKSERSKSDEKEEEYWEGHASTYDDTNPLAPFATDFINDLLKNITATDSLLEIGPGTGGFTTLLAPHVQSVTIVEPSAAMYEQFFKKWQREVQLPLPKVLKNKWEDVSDEKADIVFGVNSFYRMKDMKDCLLKMNECASRHVFLVQSVGRPFAGPLQAEIDGQLIEVERAKAISNILDELKMNHHYKLYQVKRKCGSVHDVALIHWEKAETC